MCLNVAGYQDTVGLLRMDRDYTWNRAGKHLPAGTAG